jgi:hypothetical protein
MCEVHRRPFMYVSPILFEDNRQNRYYKCIVDLILTEDEYAPGSDRLRLPLAREAPAVHLAGGTEISDKTIKR